MIVFSIIVRLYNSVIQWQRQQQHSAVPASDKFDFED